MSFTDPTQPLTQSLLSGVKQFKSSSLRPTDTVVRSIPVVGYMAPPSLIPPPVTRFDPPQQYQEGDDKVMRLNTDRIHAHGQLGANDWAKPRAVAQCVDDARPGYNTCSAAEYLDEPDVLEKKVELVAELIRKSSRRVIYTGAGISTASGIMDYASKADDSVSKKLQREKWHKQPISHFDAQPTLAHKALTAMYADGHLDYWVQQNHDGLPQKAGFPQHALNEIHGAWYDPSNPVVAMNGNLRNDLFTDLLRWEQDVDFCLVLGTSLCGMNSDRIVVSAANSFTKSHGAVGGGAVIVGLQSTKLDHVASVRIFATIDDMVRLLAEKLNVGCDFQNVAQSREPQTYSTGVVSDPEDVFQLPYDARSGKRRDDGRLSQFDFRENAFVRVNGGPHDGAVGFVSGKNKEAHFKMTFFLSLKKIGVGSKSDNSFESKIAQKTHPLNCLMGRWWVDAARAKSVLAMPVTCLDPTIQSDAEDIEASRRLMKKLSLGADARFEGLGGQTERSASSLGHNLLKAPGDLLKLPLSLSCSSTRVPVTALYKDNRTTCYILPSLTGLQMKSAILKDLGLTGSFGDYYLRCNGASFESKVAVELHPNFGENCLLVVEDVGNRLRAVAHT